MTINRNNTEREYYYIDQSKPINLWRVLVNLMLVILTIALAVALIMAYISTGVSPDRNWMFAFFGLGASFLFLGNFIMLLVWAIRWRWWVMLPLITLLMGIGYLQRLVQVDLSKKYVVEKGADLRQSDDITVMTYNVHGFIYGDVTRSEYIRTVDSVAAYVRRVDPDVVCFQEYETMQRSDVRRMDSLYRKWPYRAYNLVYDGGGNLGYGLAVFSRMPIVGSHRKVFEGSSNSMIWVDLMMEVGDTIRLFNSHLQSTQIDEASRKRLEKLDIRGGDNGVNEKLVRSLGNTLRDNYRRRAVQVDTVAQMINDTRHPVILVGDFNDTPVSYSYRKMRGDLEDTFINAGTGVAYTYNRLFSMLRIDYVFHSPIFETKSYRSDDLPWSDHNPVVARLRELQSLEI